MRDLTEKQRRFCDLYIKYGQAYTAARKAGYSEKYARSHSSAMLENPTIRKQIDAELNKIRGPTIADAKEVMEYLTAVMRGNTKDCIVVMERKAKGHSRAREMPKHASLRERTRAAAELARRYDFTSQDNDSVQIIDDSQDDT